MKIWLRLEALNGVSLMNIKTLILAFIASTMAATSAYAVPITYQLQADLFGGGTVSGTFMFDADTDLFSDISISTMGSTFPDTEFTEVRPFLVGQTPLPSDTVLTFVTSLPLMADVSAFAEFEIEAPLPISGSVAILPSFALVGPNGGGLTSILMCGNDICTSSNGTGVPVLAGGTISTVSEVSLPAAAWMFLAGLGGLSAARRKKRAIA